MSLGSHQRCVGLSQNHITPYWIIERLKPIDLDPCASALRPWDCARINWTEHGLERDWPRHLFIYLNPPFNRFEVGAWIAKLAEHGNGITLLSGLRLSQAAYQSRWRTRKRAQYREQTGKVCAVDPVAPAPPPIISAHFECDGKVLGALTDKSLRSAA
jgi:hypothetical protein